MHLARKLSVDDVGGSGIDGPYLSCCWQVLSDIWCSACNADGFQIQAL